MKCKFCHSEVTPLPNGNCPKCFAFIKEEKPKKTSKKVTKQEEIKDGK